MATIGLLGGSFDPPHNGHLTVALAVFAARRLDRVDLLVGNLPPHAGGKAVHATVDHRLAMARLAVAGRPGLGVEDIETRREGKSYTIDTMRQLEAERPDDRFVFIIGGDMLADLPRWREARNLTTLVDFAPVFRPGHAEPNWENLAKELGDEAARTLRANVVHGPLLDISSTRVREALASGASISHWVPPAVEAYIRAHRLYV